MNDKKYVEEVCSKCENKLNDKDLCNIRININGNANCVNYKEKSIILNKWNYEKHKYEKYCVPSEWNVKIYTGNMEEIINCAHCGRKIKAGDSNTSCEIHNEVGIGYGICGRCFNKEMMRKRYKGDKVSNIYDMSGKKKVIFTEEPKTNITYKEIMKIIVEHATEEGCHNIFCEGGINMCPSDVFGSEKIDKQKEEDICNYESIGCTKCWTNAVENIRKGKK